MNLLLRIGLFATVLFASIHTTGTEITIVNNTDTTIKKGRLKVQFIMKDCTSSHETHDTNTIIEGVVTFKKLHAGKTLKLDLLKAHDANSFDCIPALTEAQKDKVRSTLLTTVKISSSTKKSKVRVNINKSIQHGSTLIITKKNNRFVISYNDNNIS